MSREMFHTTNLKAATALVTLGFELLNPPVTRTVRDDGEDSTVFWFEPRNKEGKKAIDVYRGMTKGGEDLNESDPENPINYIRTALGNRDELISLIRNTPRNVVIKRMGRSIAIREDASKEQKEQFKPYL
jgi:hypothetical protein